MTEYEKVIKLQELLDQRTDLLWEHINTYMDKDFVLLEHVSEKIRVVQKQIKELQNG